VIFHNVVHLTKILPQLTAEGQRINPEAVAVVRPYLISHRKRFGHFPLNTERIPEPVEYDLPASLLGPGRNAAK
jgi:Tn3 transposase DDE domain